MQGIPHFRDKELGFLTKKQAEFIEKKEENQIIEFDFLGVKYKAGCNTMSSEGNIEGVYLVEVKTGRRANVGRYLKNPKGAFSPDNVKKAKAIGFKVILVVVELLEDWKCKISLTELP